MSAPPPKIAVEADPFIPYVAEADYPESLRPVFERYQERMGFLPNALRLYMHRPEIAELLWELNNRIMRDPSSALDVGLKRRLGAVASKTNGCTYCTTHHCTILKRPGEAISEGWNMADGELRTLLAGDLEPEDDFEAVCFEYVRAASADPGNVPRDLLDRLAARLTPAQIMELAALVGFWKFYNTVHDSLHVPTEAALLENSGYVDV